jgi:hypothetical protein
MWADVVHLRNQRCSAAGVRRSLAEQTGHPRGDVLDLATLWRLAAHWRRSHGLRLHAA